MSSPLVNIASQIARSIGKIVLRAFDEVVLSHTNKKNLYVSLGEVLVQEVKMQVTKNYPGHQVVLAENFLTNADRPTWIVDPVSSLENFSRGYPEFATTLAVVDNGKTICGVVYDPIRQELFSASENNGACVNNYKIRVEEKLSSNFVVAQNFFEKIVGEENTRMTGCPSLNLAYLASSRIDAVLLKNYQEVTLKAGLLLAKEAGCLTNISDETKKYLIVANPKTFHYLTENT